MYDNLVTGELLSCQVQLSGTPGVASVASAEEALKGGGSWGRAGLNTFFFWLRLWATMGHDDMIQLMILRDEK